MPEQSPQNPGHSVPILGLTGGVASGKSHAADLLAARGAHVVDTDIIARQLLERAGSVQQAVVAEFGTAILNADGVIDRARLRELVFNHAKNRSRLESIMHPAIARSAREQAQHPPLSSPYVIVVVPLLAQRATYARYHHWLDGIICIHAQQILRAQRLCQRPGIDARMARNIIAAQANDFSRSVIADWQLHNNADITAFDCKLLALDRQMRISARR